MAEFLGVGAVAALFGVPALLAMALLGLAVPYTVIRLRDESPPDPQLGAKILFQCFFSAGVLIALTGATILAVEWMYNYDAPPKTRDNPLGRETIEQLLTDGFSMTERAGFGVILSGLIAAAAGALCLHSTTSLHRQRVRRSFIGWRLAVHSVIVMVSLTAMMVLVLQQGAFDIPLVYGLRIATAVFLVWSSSWIAHLVLLFNVMQRIVRSDVVVAKKEDQPAPPVIPAALEVVVQKTSWEILDDREPPSEEIVLLELQDEPPAEAPPITPPPRNEEPVLTPEVYEPADEEVVPVSTNGSATPENAEVVAAKSPDDPPPSAS